MRVSVIVGSNGVIDACGDGVDIGVAVKVGNGVGVDMFSRVGVDSNMETIGASVMFALTRGSLSCIAIATDLQATRHNENQRNAQQMNIHLLNVA